jgi:hypothetical protein
VPGIWILRVVLVLAPLRCVAESGLLFHLSGSLGLKADVSAGATPEPNFASGVGVIADGARGVAIRCEHTQMLSYWAPGNIYAQRGTVSFFWRAREPVGPTEFPIFRVGYANHSSWDMVWLRIDYNGRGFDAFVTDTNLARTRVSTTLAPFPAPDRWIHLALTWDETSGIRFYVDGQIQGEAAAHARFDAELDQFGPHSRIISPYRVQSDYNFVRGGDLDELRIYDRALAANEIVTLASGNGLPELRPLAPRELAYPRWRDEWFFRHGWNDAQNPPAGLPHSATRVRKVALHDAYDLKRWWWKGTDGFRESTWPGVYNRSRLPGRNDYFQLPDWDCYSLSGRAITFHFPDEPWNQVEISGSAWGSATLSAVKAPVEAAAAPEKLLFSRERGRERTVHRLAQIAPGRAQLRFENVEAEEPIGEFSAFLVTPGEPPAGTRRLGYRAGNAMPTDAASAEIARFVAGRHPADEGALVVAEPVSAMAKPAPAPVREGLPFLHFVIPPVCAESGYNLGEIDDALDGIELKLPQWNAAGSVFFNLRVKDPLWPARDMLDFTFSADPGKPHTLWLDLRDRILPAGRALYLTIAVSEPLRNVALLAPEVTLVFKAREAGRAEHEQDRFTQVRDNYAMLVEEMPQERRYRMWARFEDDLNDLLRVNPQHTLGLKYRAVAIPGAPRVPFRQPEAPAGVPLWAFRQVELLGRAKRLALWYLDHRQIENGELGGGLSDDTDFLNYWPGLALMGCAPDRLADSVRRLLDACYAQGMVTRGLPTIQTDELHTYEEGINSLGQILLLDHGSPRQLARAMETTRSLLDITGINAAGHRHFRSAYFGGTRMATEGVWGWSKALGYLVLQPTLQLGEYNGNPEARKLVIELADGLLAHRRRGPEGRFTLPSAVHFETDQEGAPTRPYFQWALFWNAWRWTGDRKYLDPILDPGTGALGPVTLNLLDQLNLRQTLGAKLLAAEKARVNADEALLPASAYPNLHFAWQLTGDKGFLERLYAAQIEAMDLREYINTEGGLWIDRVYFYTAELQRARLGGVALVRNAIHPGHVLSWRFQAPATDQSVAVLVPDATRTAFKVIAYNLEDQPVHAALTTWDIEPGKWEVTQGIDTTGEDRATGELRRWETALARSHSIAITLPPRATTVFTFKHSGAATTPYQKRPDWGLDPTDVQRRGDSFVVTVHSLGSVEAPESQLCLLDGDGRRLATSTIPRLDPPNDLQPKTVEVILRIPEGRNLENSRIVIDPDAAVEEITERNNSVALPVGSAR